MAYPCQIFSTLRDNQEKNSLPVEASAPAFTQPQPFQSPSSSSPPPLPTLLHWVSPRFYSQSRPRFLLEPPPPLPPPPPPPLRSCIKGRVEKGGSVQQANQAFCLCLCRGVRGLFSLALEQQQQLVQRKRRERELKTEGGGGDGEEEKEMSRRGI